jgi:hypothetical protein
VRRGELKERTGSGMMVRRAQAGGETKKGLGKERKKDNEK